MCFSVLFSLRWYLVTEKTGHSWGILKKISSYVFFIHVS
jgi:hypothetical protein